MSNKIIDSLLSCLEKTNCSNILVYDMKSYTPFYDYSIIGSVNTSRSGMATIEYLKEEASKLNLRIRSVSSSSESKWFLIDLDLVIVHIFVGDERERFNLDAMYSN